MGLNHTFFSYQNISKNLNFSSTLCSPLPVAKMLAPSIKGNYPSFAVGKIQQQNC